MRLHEEVLKRYLDYEAGQQFKEEPANLYEPINYILSLGGKKVRPVLTLLSASLYDQDYRKALPMAHALELFHNFTLIHDDVMDHAEQRRKQPTVHIKWDLPTAILSGDEMLIRTIAKIHEISKGFSQDFLEEFLRTATEVCQGQQSDMDFEKLETVEEGSYTEMIRLKTAVLLAIAMKFGAAIGGADHEQQEIIYKYAIQIGLGFQMMDDYLDSFGDAGFGKRIGGDILEDKKTWLYIKALELGSAGQKAVLKQWHGPCENEEEKIESVRSIYEDLGIPELCLQKINFYFENAEKYLDQMTVSEDRKRPLQEYINLLSNRNT